MRFDLTDLRLFLAVADAGSITGGADAAGLSLAAASERLREMEAAGGVRLFDRGRRGVVPTAAGEALLHHARTILGQVARMRSEVGRFARGMRSTVRLLANTAATTELLPARLGPWLAAHSQADIALEERPSTDIARSVALGFADIGVLAAPDDPAGLVLYPFATDRLVVVVARGHALATRHRVNLAELAGEPFVALTDGALQTHLDTQAARVGLRWHPRVRLPSFEDVCRVAGTGAGIGIVSETAALRTRASAGIAIVRLADPWAARRLSVCVRAGAEPAPLTQALLEHLAQHAGGRPVMTKRGAP